MSRPTAVVFAPGVLRGQPEAKSGSSWEVVGRRDWDVFFFAQKRDLSYFTPFGNDYVGRCADFFVKSNEM